MIFKDNDTYLTQQTNLQCELVWLQAKYQPSLLMSKDSIIKWVQRLIHVCSLLYINNTKT